MIALYTALLPVSLALVGYVLMWVAGFGRDRHQGARRFTAIIANALLGITLALGMIVADEVKPDGLAAWMLAGWAIGVATCAVVASLRPVKKSPSDRQDS